MAQSKGLQAPYPQQPLFPHKAPSPQKLVVDVVLSYPKSTPPERFSFLYTLENAPKTAFEVVSTAVNAPVADGNTMRQLLHITLAPQHSTALKEQAKAKQTTNAHVENQLRAQRAVALKAGMDDLQGDPTKIYIANIALFSTSLTLV